MPKALQIFLLKKRFGNLDLIDWDAIVDSGLTFPENLHNIERNHIDEIEHAQHEGGYKTESEKEVELADIAWAKELEYMVRLMQEYDMEPEQEEVVPAEDSEPEDSEGWRIEQTDDWEIHSVEVEIQWHKTRTKGKDYQYGRIQLSVDPNWIGLPAKVSISIPRL
jgi:hypothetical protein